ncbi:MAG: UPF0149 family protein [Thiotrichaceae bacterium]
MEESLDYMQMESLLRRADCQYCAAEIQGVACGLLAVNLNADDELWLGQVFQDRDPQNHLQQDISIELKRYIQGLRTQMQDSNLEFGLLLPNDEEDLRDRVDAMQEWTQGFLLGVSLAGLKDFSALPDDSKELMDDFIEITKAGEFDTDELEESEDAYWHIVEYLRMGVLLISEELQPSTSSATIH